MSKKFDRYLGCAAADVLGANALVDPLVSDDDGAADNRRVDVISMRDEEILRVANSRPLRPVPCRVTRLCG